MADRFASFLDGLRGAFRREPLPSSLEASAADPRPGLLRVIFAREALPFEEATAPTPQRGNLALLFAVERLPQGPPRPARRRSPWLAWLLRPERLDD